MSKKQLYYYSYRTRLEKIKTGHLATYSPSKSSVFSGAFSSPLLGA